MANNAVIGLRLHTATTLSKELNKDNITSGILLMRALQAKCHALTAKEHKLKVILPRF